MLHAVRGGLAGVLGDRPAVLARQIRQQPEQEPADPRLQLDPAEPAGDPLQQLIPHPRAATAPGPTGPAIRSSSSSTPADQPAGPTLARATTAGPSDVLTPDDGHAVAALFSLDPPSEW